MLKTKLGEATMIITTTTNAIAGSVYRRHEHPRIAILSVGEIEVDAYQPVLIQENVLLIFASDIDVFDIPAWTRGLLMLPDGLSRRVKKNTAIRNKMNGRTAAYLSIGDARAILRFGEKLKATTCNKMTISGENETGGVLTVTEFLQGYLNGNLQPPRTDTPNAWFDYLLRFAGNELQAQSPKRRNLAGP